MKIFSVFRSFILSDIPAILLTLLLIGGLALIIVNPKLVRLQDGTETSVRISSDVNR